MPNERYSLDGLARRLGRDRRELEKLAQRGRIPGRRVAGEWEFQSLEIAHWLEAEMVEFSDQELKTVETTNRPENLESNLILTELLTPETMEVPMDARTKRSVIEKLVEIAGRTWHVWSPAKILEAVIEREEIQPTAFPSGVALPHPRTPTPGTIGESVIAYGRTNTGIPFGAPKRALNDIFFLILAADIQTHLSVLARLGRLLQTEGFIDGLRESPDVDSTWQWIADAEQNLIHPPKK